MSKATASNRPTAEVNLAGIDKKLDRILLQNSELQLKASSLTNEVNDIKISLDFMSKTVEDLQTQVNGKADVSVVKELSKDVYDKLDDLENRSKRNNLVFWNVLEKLENQIGCSQLIENLLAKHMKIDHLEEVVIERAHRSGKTKKIQDGSENPGPIHVKFMNWSDKEFILHRAPSALKDNPLNPSGAKIIVTDDVSKKVRDDRKLLRSHHLPDILERPDVKVAFIPYVIPSRIKYKQGDSWKYFYLPQ